MKFLIIAPSRAFWSCLDVDRRLAHRLRVDSE